MTARSEAYGAVASAPALESGRSRHASRMRPRMAYVFALVMMTLLTFFSTGCFGMAGGGSNYGYYGGGGIGLFAIIIIAAILFGKRRR